MKKMLPIVILTSLIIVSGCSQGHNRIFNPIQVENDSPVSEFSGNSDYRIIDSGIMNLESGKVETDERPLSPYLDITPYLGANFSYQIVNFIPPDVFYITLQINNVTALTVYDVCIVFDELYGKTVMNPDSYMDIFQPWDIDPFIAFRKKELMRDFPPGIDTQKLYLKYPSGASPLVKYFIIAHIGGNTGGVYEISNWSYLGDLTPSGGSTTISVDVYDHQMNVSYVVANTSVLTGGLTFFQQAGFPNPWEATITNSQNAPVGTYTIPVMSQSPSSPAYHTFNYFTIDVKPEVPLPTVFGENKEIEGDDVFLYVETLSSGHHGIACRNDNFYLGFWGQSEYNEGAVFFTKSSDKGENWTVAQPITDPDDDYLESNPAMALGTTNIYIVFQSDQLGDSKIGIAVSSDEGATWTLHWVTQYFSGAHYEPSVCVNNDISPEIIYVAFIGVFTNDFLGVAHASASNPDSWTYTDVNDSSDGPLTMAGTSIAYNQVTDRIMVCWSDERADIYPDGNRVAFDSSSNGINWGTDIWISDIWNSGDNEDEASLAINPMTGVPGILYWHFDYNTHRAVIRFVKATDSTGTAFLPSIVISDLDAGHWSIVGPTLQCEPSGRWLAAWAHSEWSFVRYNCFFDESFDDGVTWGVDTQVNDPINPTVYNPVLATNGRDVVIGWTDERSGRTEIYVDHGTH